MPDVSSTPTRPAAPARPTVTPQANGATAPTTAPTTPTPPTTPAVSDGFEQRATAAQKKAAEKALGAIGYHPGAADGRINGTTREAIKAFQKNRGLDVTGDLTRETYKAIRGVEKDKHRGVQTAGYVSDGVKKVESRLKRLGYDVGRVDGAYDQKTASAVRAFKTDQKMESRGGSLGDAGRKSLNKEIAGLAHKPFRNRVKNTDAHKRADRTATTAANNDGLRVGDHGPAVATIQRHLKSAGFDPKRTDGVFDERTAGMVKEFQRKAGLKDHGIVGAGTWKRLRTAQMEAANSTSPHQTKGEKSQAVKRTEQLLKKAGFNPGKIDGLYDAKTQRALDKFRKKFDLGGRGDGVGAATLKKLRLGASGQLLSKGTIARGYVNGRPHDIRVVTVDGYQVERSTAAAFAKMRKAAARDGITIPLNSGFRTNARQAELYNGYIRGLPGYNPANPPGYSNHQSGAALDLGVQTAGDSVGVGSVYNWLARNAGRFGFQRIASEAWHWEFQPLMRKYGL